MNGQSTLYYDLRAYLVKADDRGGVEYHARHLGFHASMNSAELAVREQVGKDGENLLDTNSRRLSYFELNAYDARNGPKIVESRVYDRRGGTLSVW